MSPASRKGRSKAGRPKGFDHREILRACDEFFRKREISTNPRNGVYPASASK